MFDRATTPKRLRVGRITVTVALACITLSADALIGQQSTVRGRRIVLVEGREAIEGEVIVRYRSDAGRIERERAEFQADSDGAESIGRRARHLRSRQLTTAELLATLRANPDVEFVEPNYVIRALAMPSDPSFGSLWGLFNTGQHVDGQNGVPGADIGAVEAWDITTGSRATVVGVLDTGIDFNHPDLAPNLFSAPRNFTVTIGAVAVTCVAGTHGFNAITNSCVPFDDNEHGTHVAGIIGAVGNNGIGVTGVNWTANLMALKVLDSNGSGTTADAIKAIDFAIKAKAALGADANVRVLNASWGGSAFSQALDDQIEVANAAGMLFVAAAGTEGTNNDVAPHYPASSTRANVMSVAAADNTGQLASYSNYGATTVDLAAPGASTLSTLPGNQYGYLGGTSMSAPFVSGAAALILSVCPSEPAALRSRLMATVDPVAGMSGKVVSGGRLNVSNALQHCPTLNATISGSTITAMVDDGNGSPGDWLGLYCPATNGDSAFSEWKYLNGTRTQPASGFSTATVTFQAPAQSGVSCNVRLFSNNSYEKLATSQTVVTGSTGGGTATITLATTTVSPGGVIQFSVTGPGNQKDWVALAQASAADSSYLDWQFLNGQKTAPATGVSSATLQFTAPTTPGSYNIRFFANNTMTKLATSATITVASAPPTPSLSIADVSVAEGNSGTSVATFTVTLSPVNSSQTVTVNYATADGSATAASNDYVSTSGTLTFAPSTATRTISVTINGDATVEPNETFLVNLSGATNAVIGDAQAVGTITSEETSTSAAVTVASTTVAPGAVIQFTVSGGPGNAKDWVSLARASAADGDYLDWMFLNGQKTAPASGVSGGTLQFTAPTTPGTYNIRFFANNTLTKLATSATITVGSGVAVTVASTTVSPGGVIQFTVSGGPGNAKDWVSLARASAADGDYVDWMFLNGQKTAPATGVSGVTLQFTAPTTPGTYNIRFFANNTFTKLATSATITVGSGAAVTVAATTVAPGGVINFSVSGGPANAKDWVSLARTSAPDSDYLDWKFLNGQKTAPAAGVSGASLQFTAPATPGTYNIRFFENNSLTKLATSATITVSP